MGARSSRPSERGWGVVGGLQPRAPPLAPPPRYCRISCFRKVSNISLDHSYLFRIFGIIVIIPLLLFSTPEVAYACSEKNIQLF